ncbi:MAG: DUF1501 domain-containing protein [Planctomycetia bacterium]|nr:DUF1501 domain-containing protein [Planctomycetia bacterium]
MLRITTAPVRLCDHVSRREFLRIGGLGAVGLSLVDLIRHRADAATTSAAPGTSAAPSSKARSCIVLVLMGGPPQHSTWDPKPNAPAEVRGEFAPIATRVPGLSVSELLPKTATLAEHLCLLRAVRTGDNAHSSSGYYMFTGVPHQPMNMENANPGAPNNWPHFASIVRHLQSGASTIPAAVRLPHHIWNTDGSVWPGQDAGFLGRAVDPWLFRCEPAAPEFRIPEFALPAELPFDRFEQRRSLLGELDRLAATAERRANTTGPYDKATAQAFDLLTSAKSRGAVDLSAEPDESRDRYGRSQFGQSVLLARRLVEAGVRLVQVNWFRGADEPSDAPCWDSHVGEAKRLKTVLLPPFDQAYSALLTDLVSRGLLDETLVVCMSEFGRSPKINAAGGRDHWGSVFSVSLAGGGIRGGFVHGASDALGGEPKDGLVRPPDLLATIFHSLGISPSTEMHDPLGRPFAIARGEPIREILG